MHAPGHPTKSSFDLRCNYHSRLIEFNIFILLLPITGLVLHILLPIITMQQDGNLHE